MTTRLPKCRCLVSTYQQFYSWPGLHVFLYLRWTITCLSRHNKKKGLRNDQNILIDLYRNFQTYNIISGGFETPPLPKWKPSSFLTKKSLVRLKNWELKNYMSTSWAVSFQYLICTSICFSSNTLFILSLNETPKQ